MSDLLVPKGTTPVGDSPNAAPLRQHVYATKVADLDVDADKVVALWRTGLSQNGMPEAKLDWYYRQNPEGTPLVVLLDHVDTRESIGVAAVGPRRIRFGGVTMKAGALVDFVTQPEHRTFFPAILLQKETQLRALGEFTFLFGFPNPKALPIMRRVGYRCMGQMVRRTRVLRSSTYLAKYLPVGICHIAGGAVDGLRLAALFMRGLVIPGLQSQWQERPDGAFDELWKRAATRDVVMGVRDMAFLTWRFVNLPSRPFRFFTLVSPIDKNLVAYAVCMTQDSVLQVHDFLVDPTVPSAGARLWLNLSREAIRMGHNSLSVEFLGSDHQQRQLSAAGLLVRGTRPVYGTATQLSGGANMEPTDRLSWYITLADDDW